MNESINNRFAGPLLYNYTLWVLSEAKRMNIKRLYFLARDGALLREIALLICKQYELDIDCRYLYCSRAALRMPTYYLIGEEAFDLLLLGGYQLTPRSILKRAGLDESQRRKVYQEIDFDFEKESQKLTWTEFDQLKERLLISKTYRQYCVENSRNAYPAAMQYLRQEKVLEQDAFAVVDSGWSGSMQRSFRQLLESAGYNGKLVGFYFGMYVAPKDAADGTYCTWYFDGNGKYIQKSIFSNNLFECLLAADHGMTYGYQITDGISEPLLMPAPSDSQANHIREVHEEVLQYVAKRIRIDDFQSFNPQKAWKETNGLIWRYMFHPTKAEAEYYGRSLFCDDVTEDYYNTLADEDQLRLLKNYTVLRRIRYRFSPNENDAVEGLFWPYGTVAFLPMFKRWWYRLNILAWQMMKYLLRHC